MSSARSLHARAGQRGCHLDSAIVAGTIFRGARERLVAAAACARRGRRRHAQLLLPQLVVLPLLVGAAARGLARRHRSRILELIQQKIDGKEISVAPEERPEAKIIDLMEALKASVKGATSADRERKPAQRASKKPETATKKSVKRKSG